MAVFIFRRLLIGFFVLLASTLVMYILVANAGDPLARFYESSSPNRDQQIANVTAALNLDQNVFLRYLDWLGGASQCLLPGIGSCDLGQTVNGTDVLESLPSALATTLRLVLAATVLAIILGVSVGIVSALRQYSGFDYSITFLSFLFYSLPIFWVAVLLKQFGAIAINDWLVEPTFAPSTIVVVSLLMGLTWMTIIAGDLKRRAITFAVAAAATAAVMIFTSASQWFKQPALGPVLIAVTAIGAALIFVTLITGLENRRILITGVGIALLAPIASLALAPILVRPTYSFLFILLLVTLVISGVIGWFGGGPDYRPQGIRVALLTGAAGAVLVAVDRVLSGFARYTDNANGRPIPTTGESTPNFRGDVWQQTIDVTIHLALPTIAMVAISFAFYTRYTRSSMLEVMNQDYIRTARAKGLSERTVVMRHAFRNSLIPLATVVAIDFAAVLGGAVVTEKVFGWKGMGSYFVDGLINVDPNPVMAFFLVTAIASISFNIIADIVYAFLDPRIRLS